MQILKQENKPSTEVLNDTLSRYEQAKKRRDPWLGLWDECYSYALPQRDNIYGNTGDGQHRTDHLFDATAMDAVDQLAASLLAELTPPWSGWFGLKPGIKLSPEEAEAISPKLEEATKVLQDHFDRSNFSVEIHQAFLDLVTAGTASICFEESDPGNFSAFKFSAVPLSQIVLDEGVSGTLDVTYRVFEMTYEQIVSKFPASDIPAQVTEIAAKNTQETFEVLEAVMPEGLVYRYVSALTQYPEEGLLANMQVKSSPFINFRWLKSPGEIYGRSPVMKTLPDIKTANKVVELILKNASISVTGIWQADDDGVLNPANIELKPGTIIPKAVGSQGLKPLDMPGRFDISELVLDDLRGRIRRSMLTDRLAQISDRRRMTATEILERSAEVVRILGATYGRLQSELLTPLIERAYTILRRRGEIPDLALDGRIVALDYRSPLARAQAQKNVQNILSWINTSAALGAAADQAVDFAAAIRFLGNALGVPSNLIIQDLQLSESLPSAAHKQDSQQSKEI